MTLTSAIVKYTRRHAGRQIHQADSNTCMHTYIQDWQGDVWDTVDWYEKQYNGKGGQIVAIASADENDAF